MNFRFQKININLINKKILVTLLFALGSTSYGQSVTGTSGLIHIPSARMLEDGQLVLGGGYIPKHYFYRMGVNENPGLTTYITYQILPFVELMFRYTHELNVFVNTATQYFPDRMVSVRFKLLEEKKYIPAIVLGAHDFSKLTGLSSASSLNSMYTATYFVTSKKIYFKGLSADTSFGYAFDFLSLKTKDYRGIFYGIELKSNNYDFISLIIENNSKNFNTGFRLSPFRKFNIIVGLWDFKKPTFSFNYRF